MRMVSYFASRAHTHCVELLPITINDDDVIITVRYLTLHQRTTGPVAERYELEKLTACKYDDNKAGTDEEKTSHCKYSPHLPKADS